MGTKSLFGRRSAAKPAHSRRGKRGAQKPAFAARSLRIERFEDRLLLSISTTPALESALYSQAALVGAPQVLSVIPNTGSIISNGAVLQSAPQQLTIQFNAGEKISPATLNAITLTRTDAAGNTTTVGLGYVGVNDAPNQNQVVVRFDSTLLSGTYMLNVATTLKDSNGNALSSAYALTFTLDLGAMVSSVVPQPVTRSISGQLQQNLKEIDVYFTDPLDPVSAQNPQLYQVIATNQTADTNDQGTPVNPVSVTYNAAKNEAVLLFAQNLNTLVQPTGTNSLRLRIGDFNEPITTTTIAAAEGEAGTSYAEAMQLSSTAFGSGPQSVAISNQIEATSYDLQWPGGPTDPGDRNLPAEPDVAIEAHFMGASGESTLGIPTYTYYFPVTYGVDANGNPVRNLITPAQEQRTREIFELYSYYFGVQFEEAAPGQTGDIGVCTGNLFPMGGTSGPGGVLGMGGGGLAVMDGAENWGTSPFGGEWQQVAMHEIMHCLGFGHSFELPADQIMGDDGAQGTSELTLPGLGDLDTALNMFRPQSTDIDMYQFTVSTPGTFSAETFAQRLSDPSLLNTELRLFTKNADGTYSVVAQNDDYFSNDSYIDLQLQPGTYYVGVSASGTTNTIPSCPTAAWAGRRRGLTSYG